LSQIESLFSSHCWALVFRGIAAIVFGVLAFMWPAVVLATLAVLFGYYALVENAK